MSAPAARAASERRGRVLLAIAILATAANLRPALASVGPVLPGIRADLALSGTAAAILTTAPVLCFGLLAPFARPVARRLGAERTVVVALAGLAAGLLVRLGTSSVTLLLGTIIAGGAIAFANVLLPVIVKVDFPTRAGIVTGLYTTVMSGASAMAAAVTVPVGLATGLGWRAGLGLWLLPALVALVAWLPRLRHPTPASAPATPAAPAAPVTRVGRESRRTHAIEAGTPASRRLVREPLAWQMAFLFGLQSLGFYAVLAWLPSIEASRGFDPTAAGGLLGLAILVGTPAAFIGPTLAARAPDQRLHLAVMSVVTGLGLLGLLVAPPSSAPLWVVLVGAGQGAMFPMVLTVIVLRSRTAEETAGLSVFAQSVGYVVAAGGPLLVGLVHDATHAWAWPLLLLSGLTVPQMLLGLAAGRRRHLGATGSGEAPAVAG